MKVLDLAENLCKGRLMGTLEGGYGVKFADSVITTINVFSKVTFNLDEDLRHSSKETIKTTNHIITELKQKIGTYWAV